VIQDPPGPLARCPCMGHFSMSVVLAARKPMGELTGYFRAHSSRAFFHNLTVNSAGGIRAVRCVDARVDALAESTNRRRVVEICSPLADRTY